MNILEEQFLVFKIDEEKEDFEEIKITVSPLCTLLDPKFIFLIIVPIDKEIWIWHGSNSTVRMKFIATQEVSKIRDKYGVDFKISAVDGGDESPKFKEIVGLE